MPPRDARRPVRTFPGRSPSRAPGAGRCQHAGAARKHTLQNTHLPTLPGAANTGPYVDAQTLPINTRRAPANTPGEITNCAMASPPGSPSSRWWNRPIKPEPEIGPNELEVETMVAGRRPPREAGVGGVHYVGYLPDERVFDATHRRARRCGFSWIGTRSSRASAAAAQLGGRAREGAHGARRATATGGFLLVPPKTAPALEMPTRVTDDLALIDRAPRRPLVDGALLRLGRERLEGHRRRLQQVLPDAHDGRGARPDRL